MDFDQFQNYAPLYVIGALEQAGPTFAKATAWQARHKK
jgi:hypothetical protein